LSSRQQQRRNRAYATAIARLAAWPLTGGVRAPASFTFQNPTGQLDGVNDARIDIEVRAGVAFNC
jgi:hypothetical protein